MKIETVFEKYQTIQKIGTEVIAPYHVWSKFGHQQKIVTISGSDICLGEDYATLSEARAAVAWYVEQLGGKVKWSDK